MQKIKNPFTKIDELKCFFDDLYGENSTEFQTNRYQTALNEFKKLYGYDSFYVASSSGRVEICGNHTDHNGGKVLCTTISLDTLAFFMPTDDGVITVNSQGYDEFKVDTRLIENSFTANSRSLVKGVCVGLKERGYKVGGFNVYITSNVIGGAGISSSASFELLITEILNFLYNEGKVNQEEKAKISQFAENVFFFKPCGLLDQTAISYGGINLLDFSNNEKIIVENCHPDKIDYKLILVNTGGSHENLTEDYASIPREMKAVASILGGDRLIDVKEQNLYDNANKITAQLGDRAFLRAKHFFDENKRVEQGLVYLQNGDFDNLCDVINSSGKSSLEYLQNCYVSGETNQPIVKALSILSTLSELDAVRVHGGGFAGCVLCLVKNDNLDAFLQKAYKWYNESDVIPLSIRTKGTIVL